MSNKLTVYLNANIASFDAAIKKASASLGGISSAAATVGKYAATGFAVAGGALAALGLKQAAYIEQTAQLANSLGVNLRNFQALERVAKEAGVEQGALAVALTKTQKAISEAEDGTQTYVDAFDKIGLKAKDLMALEPDQQFLKIAEALSQIENPTQRTALALELFGKSGRGIINILPDLSAKMDEAREFNDKFNISLSEVDAAKVDEAGDAFGRVKDAIGGLGNIIATKFSPLITAASQEFLNAAVSGETFGRAIDSAISVASQIVDNFRITIMGLKAAWLEVEISSKEFFAKMYLGLYDLGEAIAKTLNMLTGSSLVAEQAYLDLAASTQQSANASKAALEELTTQAGKFETTAKRMDKIQSEAQARAEKTVGINKKLADSVKGINDETEDAATKTGKLAKETSKSSKEIDKFKTVSRSAFSSFQSELDRASSKMGTFGRIAFDILNEIANVISQEIFKSSGGGGIGGLIGDALGSIFSTGGLPSFATGSRYVPRDMTAKVHQGEMIIPRNQVGMGGGISVNIVNNAGAKVTARQGNGSNGPELNVMIDQMIADNLGRKGSKSNQALTAFTGQGLIRR